MRFAGFAAGMVALGLAVPGAAMAQTDMERCVAWGAQPGTQAFYNCLAALESQRAGPAPSAPAAPAKRPNVADGLATQLCVERASARPPYPIVRLATNTVSGNDPKSVSLSFKIEKPGASVAFWNVTCVFREGRMVDFKAS
ncbi:hypothetical protein [Aquabacter cavernae]|uniref:hypothetical protein n=1 Tax=Aquabacter cavernae TaxID=2496029 RepID=UPI001FDF305F|nr:hypothetical protein [Aquabacter cavernae]